MNQPSYTDICDECGLAASSVTRGIPSIATCPKGHKWERVKVVNGPELGWDTGTVKMSECKHENCLKEASDIDGGYCCSACRIDDLESNLKQRYEMHDFQNKEILKDKTEIKRLRERVRVLEKGIVHAFRDNGWCDGQSNEALISYIVDDYGTDFYPDLEALR